MLSGAVSSTIIIIITINNTYYHHHSPSIRRFILLDLKFFVLHILGTYMDNFTNYIIVDI